MPIYVPPTPINIQHLSPNAGIVQNRVPQLLAQAAVGSLQVLTPDAGIVQNRMVFSTVNEEVRPPKTLTLRNTGTAPLRITELTFGDSQEQNNAVPIADRRRAADFSLVNPPPLPLILGPNASIDLSVRFAPQRVARQNQNETPTHLRNGENYASLTITSTYPNRQTATVNLAGVNFAEYESNNEPSIAEIARIFGWRINIGTERVRLGGTTPLFGDEVYSPYWLRADTTRPVLLWPLAITRGRKDFPQGSVRFEPKPGSGGNSGFLYRHAGRSNDDSPTGIEVPGSNDLSGGENQKLLPKIFGVDNVSRVSTTDTVDFTPRSAFALNNSGSWTDDSQNGPYQLHNWRIFPVRDAQGNLVPNTWYATYDTGLDPTDPYKNFDYNDHVYLMINAKPENQP